MGGAEKGGPSDFRAMKSSRQQEIGQEIGLCQSVWILGSWMSYFRWGGIGGVR